MKYVTLSVLLLAACSAVIADVFEDFESYADTAALLDMDALYTPANGDPNDPDGGVIQISLNTTDAHGGAKSLEALVGYGVDDFRNWGFRAHVPDINNRWDWSAYEALQFYYKGDVDVRVRIYNQYVDPSAIVYENTFSNPATDQWVVANVDLFSVSRSQVILLYITVYDRTGEGVNVLFDDFELLNQTFGSAVQPYYPGDPAQMQLSWFIAEGASVDEAYVRWAPVGEAFQDQIAVSEPNDPFAVTLDVEPATDYNYEIEMGGLVHSGSFKSAYPQAATLGLESFETYEDTTDLLANAKLYLPLVYGYPASTAELVTDTPYDGVKCTKFRRAGYPNYTQFGFDYRDMGGLDLSGYDKVRIWFRGDPANPVTNESGTDAGALRFQVLDTAGSRFVNDYYEGTPATNQEWTCMECVIDDNPGWQDIGYIVIHGRKNNYGAITIWLDRLEAVKNVEIPADISGDYIVNWDDMNYLVESWLVSTVDTPEQSSTVEDFESYASELENWSLYYNSTAPSIISLLTSGAAEGSKALQWDYDVQTSVGSVYAEVLYTLESPINLSEYDKALIKIKRYQTNSTESSVYIKFLDGGLTNDNLSGKTYLPGATVAETEDWIEWEIDLHSLNYADGEPTYTQLSDITNLQGIMFGVIGNQGAGRIDMDSIRLVKNPQCSVVLDADVNGDCVVNLSDYAIIANDWLFGM